MYGHCIERTGVSASTVGTIWRGKGLSSLEKYHESHDSGPPGIKTERQARCFATFNIGTCSA
eukprot:295073-Chlamydomonas_euryale.AAC.4